MSGKKHIFPRFASFLGVFILTFLGFVYLSITTYAEPIILLQSNGYGVCTEPNINTYPMIITGNSMEAIITWQDFRNSTAQYYLQKINKQGIVKWTNNGIVSASPLLLQNYPVLVSNSNGGAIFGWFDNAGVTNTWAQNISSTGTLSWTPASGVKIFTGVNFIALKDFASDDSGGIVVSVIDGSSGFYHPKILAFDQSGIMTWGTNEVCNVMATRANLRNAHNSSGYTFTVWNENRTQPVPTSSWNAIFSDIYAQVTDSTGSNEASLSGIPVCTAVAEQSDPVIVSDSTGAIIAWKDNRNGNYDVYARKVDNNGNELWVLNGVPICTATGAQQFIDICSDGSGGAYITWQDDRGSFSRIYLQRITASGNVYPGWPTNGLMLANATVGTQTFNNPSDFKRTKLAYDGNNNVVVTWGDDRNGNQDIYAQKVSGNGVLLWGPTGFPVCTHTNNQLYPCITTVSPGIVCIAWADDRTGPGFRDIYCQFVTDSLDTVYVSPSGSDESGDGSLSAPFRTIQTGLNYVSTSGEVRLLSGVYTPEGSTFVNNAMINWPNKTGIKLVLNPGSTTPAIIDAMSLGRILNIPYSVNMTIEGINIINGKVTNEGGGAIKIVLNTNLTLNNVSIIYCTAESVNYGGAVYVADAATGSKILAQDCLFSGNTARIGGVAYQGTWEAVKCRFENNSAPYGGSGGISYNTYWKTDRSLYMNNSATTNGGVSYNDYKYYASNSIYYGNNAGNYGGIIYLPLNSPTFENCTIANNYAGTSGGVLNSNLNAYFSNSIIWGNYNVTPGAYLFINNPVTNTYVKNCIYQNSFNNLTTPLNSFNTDPFLLSTTYGATGFLTPAPGSLCIDNGSNTTLPSTLDAAGNPRLHGYARDIGAYEFQGPSIRITTPEAGKIYTGMTDMTIGWNISDEGGVAANSINLRRSQDNGLTWQPIASSLANTGIYTWESVPAGNYIISIEAANTGGLYGIASSLVPFSFSLGTVYVSNSGDDSTGLGTLSSPFKTIQKGLNAVSTGETVKVLAGTYSGTGNIALVWPQKNNITLSGDGYASSIIDAASIDRILSIEVSVNATIDSISFNNGKGPAVTGTSNGQPGGAIKSMASSLQIKNCSFNGNKAGDASGTANGGNGGAIWADNITSGTLNIKASNFNNNNSGNTFGMATGGLGGAIFSNTVTSIDASNFTNNYTGTGYGGGAGGAVNISLATVLTYITNSNFYFNKTNGSWTGGAGGAILCSNTPIIANCSFIGNSTGSGSGGMGGVGGAILCGGTGVAQIYSSQFITNETGSSSTGSAGGDGGAIVGTNIYARYCSFISNETGYSGGSGSFASGGAISATTITLESCSFKNNSAGTGSTQGGFGGAVMGNTNGTIIFVNKCTFEANAAGNGGPGTGGSGGAISTVNIGTVVATNCVFSSNRSGLAGGGGGNGGAIYTQRLRSLNCIFSSNSAGGGGGGGGNGGAIYTIVDTTATNCAFVSNEAGGGGSTPGSGGAIYANIASIVNCSLAENKTGFRIAGTANGGGIQVTNAPSSIIINSILAHNKKCLSGTFVPDQANITNVISSNVEGISTIGNISIDPKFLSYDVNNPYFIYPGNPNAFKNLGTAASSASPALNGVIRPQLGSYDIGAIEVVNYFPAISPPSVKVDGQYVSQVKYLPKLPLIEADIVDPMAQFVPTSTEVVIGPYHYWANSTYIGNNTTHITLTPTNEFPEGLNYFTIIASGLYGGSSTYLSNQMSVDSVLSVTGKMKNIPNPFRPRHGQSTVIVYTLSTNTDVKLMIYDITGRPVWQKSFAAGADGGKTNENRVIWDGKTDFNEFAGNGAYIYILTDGKKILAKGQLAVID